jgi:hypothetical protein
VDDADAKSEYKNGEGLNGTHLYGDDEDVSDEE